MRVVQIGPMPPPHGGVSTNMLAIHDMLVSLGHSSKIIDVTNRDRTPTPDADVLKPRSALALIVTLIRLKCEIVHYHIGGDFTVKLALLTFFCGMLPGKRSVVTFHSGGFAREALRFARPFSIRGFAFRSVDLVIAVTGQMLEMLKRYGVEEERVRVIPPFAPKRPDPTVSLPPDLEAFAQRSKPFLVSVGALEPEYNNEFLIKAMPRIAERFPGAGLMIVGSGRCQAQLESELANAGPEVRVKMAGNLERVVVLRLMERADTVLRITDYDGDSLAVREALSMGTPVIASDNAHRPDGVILMRMPPNLDHLTEKLIQAEEAQFSVQIERDSGESNIQTVIEAYEELLVK